jgi:hypothetical protein
MRRLSIVLAVIAASTQNAGAAGWLKRTFAQVSAKRDFRRFVKQNQLKEVLRLEERKSGTHDARLLKYTKGVSAGAKGVLTGVAFASGVTLLVGAAGVAQTGVAAGGFVLAAKKQRQLQRTARSATLAEANSRGAAPTKKQLDRWREAGLLE